MIRDSRKDSAYFDKWIAYDRGQIESMKSKIDQFPTILTERQVLYLHNFANKNLQLLISRYSRGDELVNLSDDCKKCVDAISTFEDALSKLPNSNSIYPLDIDRSQRSIWITCLSLSIFGPNEIFKQTIGVALKTPDALLNEVWGYCFGAKLYLDKDCVLQPIHKELILSFRSGKIESVPMNKYLDHWYEACKEAYWYDTDHLEDGGYFGYWCFEVALVTKVLKSTDNSFNSHILFPEFP